MKKIAKLFKVLELIAIFQRYYFGLGSVGIGSRIGLGVKFYGAKKKIKIGNRTIIESGAVLICTDPGSLIEIGDDCAITSGCYFDTGKSGAIKSGNRTSFNPYCVVYGHGGLVIGDDVRIAAQCIIIPANHRFERTDIPIRMQGLNKIGIVIESDVWIGCGSKILDGVLVGAGSVIAAGSVVCSSVPKNSIVAGVPAKYKKGR